MKIDSHVRAPDFPRYSIAGFGIDIVDVSEFSLLLNGLGADFIGRYFTDAELAQVGNCTNRVERLAGRFAAKESVMKALGMGFGDGIAFTDIEVISLPTGAPTVRLHRKLGAEQRNRKISGWMITISHAGGIAIAGAIATIE